MGYQLVAIISRNVSIILFTVRVLKYSEYRVERNWSQTDGAQ